MPYEHLADYLSALQDAGELIRVSLEVDPDLEIAAITDRVAQAPGGGPALLFENVKGSSLPVAVNLWGSEPRILRALGVSDVEEVAQRLAGLIRPALPEGWLEKLGLLPQFSALTHLPPKVIPNGPCQQVVKHGRDINLGELPAIRSWPQETAPFITNGQIYTVDPKSGARSVEKIPLEISGPTELLVHWTPHDRGFQHYQKTQAAGNQTPIAIALGGDPLLDFICGLPLPAESDPLVFGGFLREKNIELVKCRTHDLQVPAHAEIVLEGFLDATGEPQTGSAYGCRTGFYAPRAPCPAIQLTAMTHRANPLFPATIYSRSSQEEFLRNRAIQRIFQPLVKLFLPEIEDFALPACGLGRSVCFVSIRKSYPQQARKVMNGIWSLGPLMYAKLVVVVDTDVDVQDEEAVWSAVAANLNPGRDLLQTDGPADYLDHAATVAGVGPKLGIDATAKLPGEGHPRPWPPRLEVPPDVLEQIQNRWSQYGLGLEWPPETPH